MSHLYPESSDGNLPEGPDADEDAPDSLEDIPAEHGPHCGCRRCDPDTFFDMARDLRALRGSL